MGCRTKTNMAVRDILSYAPKHSFPGWWRAAKPDVKKIDVKLNFLTPFHIIFKFLLKENHQNQFIKAYKLQFLLIIFSYIRTLLHYCKIGPWRSLPLSRGASWDICRLWNTTNTDCKHGVFVRTIRPLCC